MKVMSMSALLSDEGMGCGKQRARAAASSATAIERLERPLGFSYDTVTCELSMHTRPSTRNLW